MKLIKPRFWSKKYMNFWSIILLPISIIIQCLLWIKFKITNRIRFEIPIICVGNIYLGGTGKTPVSLKVYDLLKDQKKKPVIIKKYYKDQLDEIDFVKSKSKKIFVQKKRVIAIKEAIKNNFDVIVLDDGFQDYSIYKKINILCFNEKQMIGNGHTIPSGPLRENLNSIKRSNIIIVNGKKNVEIEKKFKKISNNISIFYSKYLPENLNNFKKNYLAFAGIGNPENFFDLLRSYKIKVEEEIYFPDHYNYSKKEIEQLLEKAKKNNLHLLTTEKDYFRLKKIGYNDINFLPIKIVLENENLFLKRIQDLLYEKN